MKISIIGAGYVGLSYAILLSQNSTVSIMDINKERINSINNRVTYIKDSLIEEYLKNKKLSLSATNNMEESIKDAKYIIICLPTNYDEATKCFDTSSIDNAIESINNLNANSIIVIKSTTPVGYINKLTKKYKLNILYSPEFLKEGTSLYDLLYPSRIIVSGKKKESKEYYKLIKASIIQKDAPILYMNYDEACAVKLFSNTFLAMRIAFFNELDTFCNEKELDTKSVIDGVCKDQRIGEFYNNPSFGYGGYCLPKDTKQLLENYNTVPQNLINNIIESNITRKKYIVNSILKKNPKVVGIYRLTMKNSSDNFRNSAIIDIINDLIENGINVIVYEPLLKSGNKYNLINKLDIFKNKSDLIICNRYNNELDDVKNKVYTRDIYTRD